VEKILSLLTEMLISSEQPMQLSGLPCPTLGKHVLVPSESMFIKIVADEFIDLCLRIASTIKPGEPGVGNYGPATMPKQIAIIEGHIKDAIAKGGRVLMGGVDSVSCTIC
jgi:hypothetical protein